MNRDELEGKAEALKGTIKQAAGTLTRDPLVLHQLSVFRMASSRYREGNPCCMNSSH